MLVYLITLKIIVSRWWRLGWADYSRNFQHQTLFSLLLYRKVTESVADNSDQVSEIRLGGLRLSFPSKTSTWPSHHFSHFTVTELNRRVTAFFPGNWYNKLGPYLTWYSDFLVLKLCILYITPPIIHGHLQSVTFHFELQYIITRN